VVDVQWKYIRNVRHPRAIGEGTLRERDLVSIKYLSQEHDVARQTAAKALGLLAREGLVQRFPGIGFIVTRNAGREGLP
jgi:DNA-binding GntR family transcriptional regulator